MDKVKMICAEVERRKEFHKTLATAAAEKNLHNTMEANELLVRQYESLLNFIDSLPDEKPSKDLETEIDKQIDKCWNDYATTGGFDWKGFARHFYELGKASVPMPEDAVIFNKGVAEGKRLMMEDAVEGEVHRFGGRGFVKEENYSALMTYLDKFKDGDKVKIIIVKKEDEK